MTSGPTPTPTPAPRSEPQTRRDSLDFRDLIYRPALVQLKEELLPMPLVDEDRFLAAGVLVGLEERADLFLVEIRIIAYLSAAALR